MRQGPPLPRVVVSIHALNPARRGRSALGSQRASAAQLDEAPPPLPPPTPPTPPPFPVGRLDCQVLSHVPIAGPVLGGTLVNLSGTGLEAGSSWQCSFGETAVGAEYDEENWRLHVYIDSPVIERATDEDGSTLTFPF